MRLIEWTKRLLGRDWQCGLMALLLFCLQSGLLAWSIPRQAPTVDERYHLAAGILRWTGDDSGVDLGNPPLLRLVAGAGAVLAADRKRVNSGVGASEKDLRFDGPGCFWLVTAGRWACIVFPLLGGYVCYRWSRALFGDKPGLLALFLWTTCPNVLAHGQLVTADIAAASMCAAAAFCFWQWSRAHRWRWALLAGLALGAAQISKYVAVVLYPAMALEVVLSLWFKRALRGRQTRLRYGAQCLCILFISLFVINAAYGFRRPFASMRDALAPPSADGGAEPTRRVLPNWLETAVLPLPLEYLRGIVAITNLFGEQRQHRVYVDGEWRIGGSRLYYLYGLCLKVPLGTWLLGGVALGLTCAARNRRLAELYCVAPGICLIAFVSWATSAPFLRYAFPVLPFAFSLFRRICG